MRHLDPAKPYPTTPAPPGFWRREITNEAASLLPLIDGDMLGAEIGTHIAKTATILLYRRPGLRLYCVDSWERSPERFNMAMNNLHDAGVVGRATVIVGDSTAMAARVEEPLDFAFIDASKDPPEKYAADCDAWLPKVRPGGFIAGHDYHWPQVPPVAHALAERLGRELEVVDRTWIIRLERHD